MSKVSITTTYKGKTQTISGDGLIASIMTGDDDAKHTARILVMGFDNQQQLLHSFSTVVEAVKNGLKKSGVPEDEQHELLIEALAQGFTLSDYFKRTPNELVQ